MNNPFIKFLSLTFLLFCSVQSLQEIPPQESVVQLVINMENVSELPRNFRIPAALGHLFDDPALFYGLDRLKVSGSSQFSEEGLNQIQDVLNYQNITIVDLRQESHGFINGAAVCWRSEHNWSNIGKSLNEIKEDEHTRLLAALDEGILVEQDNDTVYLAVERVDTEEQIVRSQGLKYIRFPVADHWRPTDDIIDQFIELIKTLPAEEWLHFHCAAGKGRTTTFLAMLDIMKHGSQISLENILFRQHLIGGSDLLKPPGLLWKKNTIQQRIDFFIQFYQYCLESPDFGETWTSWSSRHQIST